MFDEDDLVEGRSYIFIELSLLFDIMMAIDMVYVIVVAGTHKELISKLHNQYISVLANAGFHVDKSTIEFFCFTFCLLVIMFFHYAVLPHWRMWKDDFFCEHPGLVKLSIRYWLYRIFGRDVHGISYLLHDIAKSILTVSIALLQSFAMVVCSMVIVYGSLDVVVAAMRHAG